MSDYKLKSKIIKLEARAQKQEVVLDAIQKLLNHLNTLNKETDEELGRLDKLHDDVIGAIRE